MSDWQLVLRDMLNYRTSQCLFLTTNDLNVKKHRLSVDNMSLFNIRAYCLNCQRLHKNGDQCYKYSA